MPPTPNLHPTHSPLEPPTASLPPSGAPQSHSTHLAQTGEGGPCAQSHSPIPWVARLHLQGPDCCRAKESQVPPLGIPVNGEPGVGVEELS